MYNRLSLIILFLAFYSCQSNSEKVSESGALQIDLEESELLDIEKFEILRFIPFETNQFNLMGLDLRVRHHKGSFYVMDIGTRDAVHRFSSDGSYLGAAVTVGEGPGQLMGLQDFQIDSESNLLVLSSIGDRSKIIMVDNSGELSTVFETDYLAGSFSIPAPGKFLLAGGYNLPYVTDRVVLANSSGTIQSTFLPNDYENEMLPMGERNFFESDENLLYTEIFNNRIYSFSEGELNPVIEIDMGKYSLPRDFWEVDLMEGFSRLQENGFPTFKAAFEDNSHYLVNIHIQNQQGSFKKLLLINKENGNSNYWDGSSSEEDLFSNPIGMGNGEIVFLTYYSVIKNERGDKLSKKLEEKDYDYPVLLITKKGT